MRIRPRYSHWIPRVLRVRAIVLYPFVLFSVRKEEVDILLWQHEMIHVRQVRREGWLRFYGLYLGEYCLHRLQGKSADQAYRAISFEADAYAGAERVALTDSEKKETGLA